MLASGLKGIEKNYELPEPVEEDIYHMSLAERKRRKIDTLPESLEKAVEMFEKSSLMKETLGDHIFEQLIANKRKEWDEFRIHVSKYETDKYLPFL
jgi:glutamine synthetase